VIFIKKIYKLLCFNIKPKPEPEPKEAYWRALELDYTRELDEYAYDFACDVSGENIEYCQEHACKNPYWAYNFALHISEANIKYCQEWACKEPELAYLFAHDIKGADLNYCLEACKGTEWYARLQVLIMEEALG